MPESESMSEEGGNRFQVLCFEQVDRLHRVMEANVPIHGSGNFPTLNIKLKDLVQIVRNKLKHEGVVVRDVRLNGGAASYILGSENNQAYNDLDLIFGVPLKSQADLQKVKDIVLSSILDFMPKGVNKERMTPSKLNEAYVHKMVKIFNDTDRWSLISLSNVRGRNVELKFADSMRRQFEFSVDSFQIILDSLLKFYEISQAPMTEHFYPTVVAESVFGNFDVALFHLNQKLIATRNPEEIRGGGLLKYCNLLVRGYVATTDLDIRLLEKYMCSRFFIDFSNVADQRQKLENYLADHFVDEDQLKYDYLMTLYSVVDESTICLMGHERRQTLALIHQMAQRSLAEQEQRAYTKQIQMYQFDRQQSCLTIDQQKTNLIIDQVYYGPFSYSFPGMDQPQHYYTVYTYDYSNQTMTSSCPYCESCAKCVWHDVTIFWFRWSWFHFGVVFEQH